MNVIKELVLKIIKNQIFNSNEQINLIGINEDLFYKIIKTHHLETICYKEFKKNNFVINSKLTAFYHVALSNQAKQSYFYEKITDEFIKNGIKFIALKGIIIKKLYPNESLRTMADIDILVEPKSYKKVKLIMNELNFQTTSYNTRHHDTYLNKDQVYIEIHRTLMSTDLNMNEHFKINTIFNSNINNQMNINENYLFMIMHMVKHFINGGIGIRNIIDYKLYNDYYKDNLDYNYINEILLKYSLDKFHEQINNLSLHWFEGKEINDLQRLENYIFSSGTYGLIKNRAAIIIVKDKNNKYYLRRIFPKYQEMKSIFPTLEKLPFLLPYYWLKRICKSIISKRYKKELKELKNIDNNDLKSIKLLLDDVGLL